MIATAVQRHRRWAGSVLLLVFGVAVWVASVIAHHTGDGVWALGTSVVVAAGLAAGGRSELVRGLRGDGDERAMHIQSVTNMIVLNVAALVAVVGSVVEQARGVHSGPWTLACVVGGVVYALVYLVVRTRV